MSDRDNLNTIVNRLVNASDPEEVQSIYKSWSDTYDVDLESFGYVAPKIGVELLVSAISDKDAKIHDAGCGTGSVGALLFEQGYRHLHGSDFSTEMLQKAEQRNCYQTLQPLDFSAPIRIDSELFDAVISIGVYSKRFKPHFLPEMLRILKSGGHFILSCRELYFKEVIASVSELFESGSIAKSSITHADYMTGQDASAYYFDLEKSA